MPRSQVIGAQHGLRRCLLSPAVSAEQEGERLHQVGVLRMESLLNAVASELDCAAGLASSASGRYADGFSPAIASSAKLTTSAARRTAVSAVSRS